MNQSSLINDKKKLQRLYLSECKSAKEIASQLGCSENKVHYWLKRHNIQKRTISEALYSRFNPNGDPFVEPSSPRSYTDFMHGLGIGLFWGEGTKANKNSVRLGNSDPELIVAFIIFLEKIFSISRSDMRFGLQIFSDMNEDKIRDFWVKKMGVRKTQFQKTVTTKSGKLGTYRQKTKYGVLTIYYHNTKLQHCLLSQIEKTKEML